MERRESYEDHLEDFRTVEEVIKNFPWSPNGEKQPRKPLTSRGLDNNSKLEVLDKLAGNQSVNFHEVGFLLQEIVRKFSAEVNHLYKLALECQIGLLAAGIVVQRSSRGKRPVIVDPSQDFKIINISRPRKKIKLMREKCISKFISIVEENIPGLSSSELLTDPNELIIIPEDIRQLLSSSPALKSLPTVNSEVEFTLPTLPSVELEDEILTDYSDSGIQLEVLRSTEETISHCEDSIAESIQKSISEPEDPMFTNSEVFYESEKGFHGFEESHIADITSRLQFKKSQIGDCRGYIPKEACLSSLKENNNSSVAFSPRLTSTPLKRREELSDLDYSPSKKKKENFATERSEGKSEESFRCKLKINIVPRKSSPQYEYKWYVIDGEDSDLDSSFHGSLYQETCSDSQPGLDTSSCEGYSIEVYDTSDSEAVSRKTQPDMEADVHHEVQPDLEAKAQGFHDEVQPDLEAVSTELNDIHPYLEAMAQEVHDEIQTDSEAMTQEKNDIHPDMALFGLEKSTMIGMDIKHYKQNLMNWIRKDTKEKRFKEFASMKALNNAEVAKHFLSSLFLATENQIQIRSLGMDDLILSPLP